MLCPVCKASNLSGPLCRRCKADLAPLFALDDQRARLLNEARQHIAAGRTEDALDLLDVAQWLREDAEPRQLRAVALLLDGDPAAAWQAYAAARATDSD